MKTCLLLLLLAGCTFESRNQISRSIQNWTGTNGVVDVYSNGKVMYRFLHVEKLTTGASTEAPAVSRPYRYGYGVMDLNQNYRTDPNEKKVYFEVSDYSTSYVLYENPMD
jgi:hypothetical protein